MKDQIDACVLLEMLLEQKRNKQQRCLQQQCSAYMYSVGRKRKGHISIPALGEIFKTILHIENDQEKLTTLVKILDSIKTCDITINSPQKEAYQLAVDIMSFDSHIEPADALRLAEASQEQARLVTLDRKLVDNQKLMQEFNLNIAMPD